MVPKAKKFKLQKDESVIICKIEKAWDRQMTGVTVNDKSYHEILGILNTGFDWSLSRRDDLHPIEAQNNATALQKKLDEYRAVSHRDPTTSRKHKHKLKMLCASAFI